MIDKRAFLTSIGAWAALATRPAFSHSNAPAYTLPEEYLPREVKIPENVKPYEIHVVPELYALYWTLPEQRAIQYTVGIGRSGLYHAGEFYVGAKRKWPSWTPTPEMIKRNPNAYSQFSEGVPGGINNPLGARALYLFQPGRGDTYLRIHGTNNARTIGRAVSNGCARLINGQIKSFYERVPLKTRVVLYPKA